MTSKLDKAREKTLKAQEQFIEKVYKNLIEGSDPTQTLNNIRRDLVLLLSFQMKHLD